jgi:hypothetical protein
VTRAPSRRRGVARAGLACAALAYAAVARPRLQTWGATTAEATADLPGDDLVRRRYQTTRAVSLAAPPVEVWPWLVQMGFGRAGWYSFDRLERLIGIGDFAEGGSAQAVLPRFQSLSVGDSVPLSAAGGLTAVVVDPPRALVLRMEMSMRDGGPAREGDRAVLDWSWAFVIVPVGPRSSRLLVRTRADYRPRALGVLIPPLLEPVHLLMERAMLGGVRRRVRSTPAGSR